MTIYNTVDSPNNDIRVKPKTRSLFNFGALKLYGYFVLLGSLEDSDQKVKNN